MNNDNVGIIVLPKFSSRTLEQVHPIIQERMQFLNNTDYVVYGHENDKFDKHKEIFTLILTIHNANLTYIKQSIDSILSQTYLNTELVIVDNGTTLEVSEYIWNTFLENEKVKLLRFSSNQYNPKKGDRNPLVYLWNAALFSSDGDFVYFMSYDDFLSSNYVECMVNLFVENSKCSSVSPKVISVNSHGQINQEFSETLTNLNLRPRYVSTIELARNLMNGKVNFAPPGGLLAHRSNLVLQSGGFDSMNDHTQLFRIAIGGELGSDFSACLFWRHHEEQDNRVQSRNAVVYKTEFGEMPQRYNLFEIHTMVAGLKFAQEYQSYFYKVMKEHIYGSIVNATKRYGLKIGFATLKNTLLQCRLGQDKIIMLTCLLVFLNAGLGLFISRFKRKLKSFRIEN